MVGNAIVVMQILYVSIFTKTSCMSLFNSTSAFTVALVAKQCTRRGFTSSITFCFPVLQSFGLLCLISNTLNKDLCKTRVCTNLEWRTDNST